ncbi:hypothetical protein BSV1_R44 (plasmid) [Borreliella finlandensis]|uniref:Uncharacterized protein n=1 Tax=Borreliella finlandensis TaxID=498741 RepID=A0A806C587_9SPIR|nr:hypothetical protein BSV1_R44 [Borreliella finlandensis]
MLRRNLKSFKFKLDLQLGQLLDIEREIKGKLESKLGSMLKNWALKA